MDDDTRSERSEDLERAFGVFDKILDQLRRERGIVQRMEEAQERFKERFDSSQDEIQATLREISDTLIRGESHAGTLQDHENRIRTVERQSPANGTLAKRVVDLETWRAERKGRSFWPERIGGAVVAAVVSAVIAVVVGVLAAIQAFRP